VQEQAEAGPPVLWHIPVSWCFLLPARVLAKLMISPQQTITVRLMVNRVMKVFMAKRRLQRLPAEVIKMDIFVFDPEILQHVDDGGVHHRRAADIVVHIFGGGVILEIVLI